MEFNNYLEKCQDDDVLSYNNLLFKIGYFKSTLESIFSHVIPKQLTDELEKRGLNIRPSREQACGRGKTYVDNSEIWFEKGVDFKILRAGSEGWQKGKMKIKVTLEFSPDEPEEIEPESPLDDIRKAINQ